MSDAPNKTSEGSAESKINMKPNFGFLRSLPGILMAVNIVLLFIAWVIMAGWKDNNIYFYSLSGHVSYFLFATITPWLVLCILFIVFIFKIHTKIPIDWPLTLCLNCAIWIILLLISSIIIANDARKYNTYSGFGSDALGAASAFGFLACVGLVIQAFFHFREYRNPV
ncbi:CKLF-like MARVEL transmembrane domain-containing protein 8 isoform X2 [Hydra vulgaris]|uniref:CKLF-like MARVEL transmembrane domain-containing protein 8 isoform X2 n=1 Tax=Hydra vulgaris TaxID=6087 RepID=A0ABM4DK43_HYDVU